MHTGTGFWYGKPGWATIRVSNRLSTDEWELILLPVWLRDLRRMSFPRQSGVILSLSSCDVVESFNVLA